MKKIFRENMSIKWFICLILSRHKWGYAIGGGKANYNCTCGMNGGCCSIPVYELTCLRCGLSVTLGEDELIDSFARRIEEWKSQSTG